MVELDKIYCEDCLETLKRMEDNSIDLIITSPPYNKGTISYQHHTDTRLSPSYLPPNYGICKDNLPADEYEQWQRKIIEECLRVLKPTGSLFYNHKEMYRHFKAVNPSFVYDYPLRQTIIWDKDTTPNFNKCRFLPTTEYIYWFGESTAYFNYYDSDFNKTIWKITPDRKSKHPAPFPIEIPTNIIKCCSKEGDIVYDPFMGSGTVAKAAMDLNRHYIGSELNPDYIIMAKERLGIL